MDTFIVDGLKINILYRHGSATALDAERPQKKIAVAELLMRSGQGMKLAASPGGQ